MAGLTDNEKKKLMLADNKIAALGEDDIFAFEETLYSLNGDIDIPGYGADILKNLSTDLKSIEKLTQGKSDSSDKEKSQKKKRKCTCPNCGFTFEVVKKQCRENRRDLAATEVAQT